MVAMVMEVLVVVVVILIGRGDVEMGRGAVGRVGQDRCKVVAAAVSRGRSEYRNSGRKLEVAAQAGVVVQVLMRGRGGTTRARARGIGERRTGGETECIQRWGGGGKAGAGGNDGGGGGAGCVGWQRRWSWWWWWR